jgi:hypothetical protein
MARRQAASRRFAFHKRSQLFIRTHNETLSVIAMRVSNENRSPLGIHGWHTSPARPSSATLAEANFRNIDSVFHKINLFVTRAGRLT